MSIQKELWGDDLEVVNKEDVKSLSDRFIIPPFSILDARQGYWQQRKRVWISRGLIGELGREATTYNTQSWVLEKGLKGNAGERSGTSIFDPVLCEILYEWFCPKGGLIVNPMAGEVVYGVVAGHLGYRYKGIELRGEQIKSNQEQCELFRSLEDIISDPIWILGDGRDTATLVGELADFIICCPPYYDLEIYSDDPRDLSCASSYADFLDGYTQIIASSAQTLHDNRFAVFAVGEIRDKAGYYRNFVGDTITICRDAGLRFYNEAILLTTAGSLAIRAGKQFKNSRKLGKSHQNILVFVKGDWREAVRNIDNESS